MKTIVRVLFTLLDTWFPFLWAISADHLIIEDVFVASPSLLLKVSELRMDGKITRKEIL